VIGAPVLAGIGETSVGRLSTGTAAAAATYSLGTGNLQVNTFTPTAAGGNITDVTLARGASIVIAGTGATGTSTGAWVHRSMTPPSAR